MLFVDQDSSIVKEIMRKDLQYNSMIQDARMTLLKLFPHDSATHAYMNLTCLLLPICSSLVSLVLTALLNPIIAVTLFLPLL